MLYVIATPIGNLEDITYRAVKILKNCDVVLCEDTRKTQVLLRKYLIKKRLFSYHKFNERRSLDRIISLLQDGMTIALLSDAGTPLLQDPGTLLVQTVIEKKIPFTFLPGPCSPINALVLSGIKWDKFQFIGYLPKKEGQRKKALQEAFAYDGATIFFESPYRLLKTLEKIDLLFPEEPICVCKELTKLHETVFRDTAKNIISAFTTKTLKGEFTIILKGEKR